VSAQRQRRRRHLLPVVSVHGSCQVKHEQSTKPALGMQERHTKEVAAALQAKKLAAKAARSAARAAAAASGGLEGSATGLDSAANFLDGSGTELNDGISEFDGSASDLEGPAGNLGDTAGDTEGSAGDPDGSNLDEGSIADLDGELEEPAAGGEGSAGDLGACGDLGGSDLGAEDATRGPAGGTENIEKAAADPEGCAGDLGIYLEGAAGVQGGSSINLEGVALAVHHGSLRRQGSGSPLEGGASEAPDAGGGLDEGGGGVLERGDKWCEGSCQLGGATGGSEDNPRAGGTSQLHPTSVQQQSTAADREITPRSEEVHSEIHPGAECHNGCAEVRLAVQACPLPSERAGAAYVLPPPPCSWLAALQAPVYYTCTGSATRPAACARAERAGPGAALDRAGGAGSRA
jgi:hypothetical protein